MAELLALVTGAVGQSRERRVLARVATLDPDTASVRFIAVPYDTRVTDAALAAVKRAAGR